MIASMLLPLAAFSSATNAAECTNSEAIMAASVWARAVASTPCSLYKMQIDTICFNAPCNATDCVSAAEGVVQDLPDCTINGVNFKTEVQNALLMCKESNFEKPGFSSDITSASTASDLGTKSDQTPSSYYPISGASLSNPPDSDFKTAPIPSSGPSSRQTLTSSPESPSMQTPTPTLSYASCTAAEIKSIRNMYVATALSDECAANSIINGDNIEILSQCNSICTNTISGLVNRMPNCFFGYEYINKKESFSSQLNKCNQGASLISIAMLGESFVFFASSSGPGSVEADDSVSRSAEDDYDNISLGSTSENSNSKSESNAASPRGINFLLWVSLAATMTLPITS